MTQAELPAQLDDAPASRERWGVARWIEEIIPRVVGAIFLWAGVDKFRDPSRTHRVFAFDGVPDALIAPLTHAVWIGEVVLAAVLILGIARRRAVIAAILVLFVYSIQLAYLIAAQNPPECSCAAAEAIMKRFASARQMMVLGLVRNAVMAAALEWVRLRMVGRAMGSAPVVEAVGAAKEDG